MKIKLLLIFAILIACFSHAQDAEYTNLTEIVNGLNKPKDLKIVDDILYVATENQILSYDITQASPTANVIFTVPSATTTTLEGITAFNIRNGFVFIVHEKIDTVNEVFLESNVSRVQLSNTTNSTVIETVSNFVSAVIFDGSLLYRVTETETASVLTVRDVAITGSTASVVTTFSTVAQDLAIFKNLVLISDKNGIINYVNVNDASPTAKPLILGDDISGILGIQIINDEIFITSNSRIYQGFLFDENVNLSIFPLIENVAYKDGGNNVSFNDIFIYKGVAYMTLAESGVIVKSEVLATSFNCFSGGSAITNLATDLQTPRQILKKDNDIYVIEALTGISKIDITNKVKTTVYTALKNGNNYELLNDFIINNNSLYFTSSTIDITNFDYVSSSLKKLDLSTSILSTLLTSTLENESIEDLDINGNNIVYSTTDNTDEEFPTSSISIYNTTTNLVTNTGLNFNFFLDDFAIDGNDIYFVQNGVGSILKGDLNNLSSPVSTFFNNDNNNFIEHITISGEFLYFSNELEVRSLTLNTANPIIMETVAVSTITNASSYDTTNCSSYEGIVIDGNTIYTSFPDANRITSSDVIMLSVDSIIKSKDIEFVINNDAIIFNKIIGDLTGRIMNITGKELLSFTVNNTQKKVSINNLNSGVYFIVLNNGTSYKFIK